MTLPFYGNTKGTKVPRGYRNYTDEQFTQAVAASYSYAQVLEKLNLVPAGGNYALAKQRVLLLELDISHFKGQAWNRGKVVGPKRPLDFYLKEDIRVSSHNLKRRLIKEGVFEPVCSMCNTLKWLDKPIPLELDHIDGNSRNNVLTNLRLLCPNCHAFTPTYRRKKE